MGHTGGTSHVFGIRCNEQLAFERKRMEPVSLGDLRMRQPLGCLSQWKSGCLDLRKFHHFTVMLSLKTTWKFV